MVLFKAPAAILSLLALSFLPSTLSLVPTPAARLDNFDRLKLALAKRQECAGIQCGWYNQVCCTGGAQCGVNEKNEAICITANDGWIYSTFYYTQAATITKASIWSTYIGPNPTGSACNSKDVCGSACCGSGEWCADASNNVCKVIGGGSAGSPGVTGTGTNPSAPVRPTSNGVIVITATGSATATVPFTTPIPTGVNGTLVEANSGGRGLSGGAIAGIVIGVIAGIILLLLICFYCCAKAAFDGILAIIGLGKKKRHTHEETTYIEEHHSGAAAGGRRWYGQAGSARPSRPPKKDSGGLGKMLGLGAGVAGVAALLGMRKKNDRKHHDDKSTTVTDSSYYYSDYTSTSKFALHNRLIATY
jgi:ubiquitin-activating enzyme E1